MIEHFHYILDEQGNPQPEPDLIKWAMWYEKFDRQVAETFFGDIRVSTVFLSLPHVNKGSSIDKVMLYETIVFADNEILARLLDLSEQDDRSIITSVFGGVDIQKRYETKDQALDGHKKMCVFIETCINKGLIVIGDTSKDGTVEVGEI